jgi:protein AATF/BFR2
MPSSRKPKTLAQQIAELQDSAPKDYDPEDEDQYNKEEDISGGSESEEAEDAGTEHYEAVG